MKTCRIGTLPRLLVVVMLMGAIPSPPAISSNGPTRCNSEYWDSVDLEAWAAEMERLYEVFRGVQVFDDEIEAAYEMEERTRARHKYASQPRPRRYHKQVIKKEKYLRRHSRELTDEEFDTYVRTTGMQLSNYRQAYPGLSDAEIREEIKSGMSDFEFMYLMAYYDLCHCSCDSKIKTRICTKGVDYYHYVGDTYIDLDRYKHWRKSGCFDPSLVPGGAIENRMKPSLNAEFDIDREVANLNQSLPGARCKDSTQLYEIENFELIKSGSGSLIRITTLRTSSDGKAYRTVNTINPSSVSVGMKGQPRYQSTCTNMVFSCKSSGCMQSTFQQIVPTQGKVTKDSPIASHYSFPSAKIAEDIQRIMESAR